jgi:hypothetical protein
MHAIRPILTVTDQVLRKSNNLQQLRKENLLKRQWRTKKPSNQSTGLDHQHPLRRLENIDQKTRRAAVAAALLVITIMNRLQIIMTLTITVVNAIIAANVKAAVTAKAVPANA